MRLHPAALLILALVAAPARAQDAAAAADDWKRLDVSEKFEFGAGHYRDSDTNLFLGLPKGFNASLEFNGYRSDTSSFTPITTLGVGKDWDAFSLSASYAAQGRANNLEANTVDVKAVMRTASKDYRTTLGADVAITHDTLFISLGAFNGTTGLTQWVSTVSVKQRVQRLRLTADLSAYSYNTDILLLTGFLITHPVLNNYIQVAGLSGLVSGFPNWSAKYGAYYDFDAVPLTAWATYQNFQLLDTFFGTHQTIDSETYGADYDLNKVITASAQYNHLRQTGSPPQDLYALTVAARF